MLAFILLCPAISSAQRVRSHEVKSPDGSVLLKVEAGARLLWSVTHNDRQVIEPSSISLTLQSGEILGNNARVSSARTVSVNTSFDAINYRKNKIEDVYNQLTLTTRDNYGVIFRVYNDAVAYSFFTTRKGEIIIMNEEANFNFTEDYQAFIPIQWDYRDRMIFNSSFEATYREIRLSQFPKDSLAFLPLLVDVGQGKKVEILEADLEDYPGMYLDLNQTGQGFKGVYAPYPLETYIKGLNMIPGKRADYIARVNGNRTFPWRVVVISEQDKDLLDCDIVQKLASPSRLNDISWLKTGQVAWDWWNSMNISQVDFRAGMNTASYKYYIDFAAKYGIPYILFDAGWNIPGDLTKARSEIDLKEVLSYGRQKGVDLIVWCS